MKRKQLCYFDLKHELQYDFVQYAYVTLIKEVRDLRYCDLSPFLFIFIIELSSIQNVWIDSHSTHELKIEHECFIESDRYTSRYQEYITFLWKQCSNTLLTLVLRIDHYIFSTKNAGILDPTLYIVFCILMPQSVIGTKILRICTFWIQCKPYDITYTVYASWPSNYWSSHYNPPKNVFS
jgi:hypothetical protein